MASEVSKKQAKSNKLPKISRFFTESKNKSSWNDKKYLVYMFTFVFFAFLLFMGIDIRQKTIIANNLDLERQQIIRDIKKWENIVRDYEDYRDGYLQLALLEYKLGNSEKAKRYLEVVFEIDPNSVDGRELEKKIN